MTHHRFLAWALAVLIGLFLLLAVLNYWPQYKLTNISGRLSVAATIFPLADIAKNIGGEYVDVFMILPPGASPHTFQPTPKDAADLSKTKLVFKIGHGLDDWVDSLAASTEQSTVITVDSDIQIRHMEAHDGEPAGDDPHYWLSAANAKIIAKTIANELSAKDPAHKDAYSANLEAYTKLLDVLDTQIKNQLSSLPHKELIVFHDAWGYFADAYGLQIVGMFEPSPGKSPAPQDIANLNNLVKQFGIKTIFLEPQLSDQSILPFTQDTGTQNVRIDPIGGTDQINSYIKLMRANADAIYNALLK